MMEYVYAAMLLHKAGKEISEDNMKKVLEAAGVSVDEAKVKAIVAALKEVDIDEAMSKAVAVQQQPASQPQQQQEEKKEEKKEEEKKSEEETVAGLGALFG